eukprot:TRINITY_DN2295_c0_g1_i1.p1 TRINITY_DN2295_c0_g1~~TRINITY_DN2295_c0_g1_i1.p1  ORF type:complete len:151 (-),score=22.16 TRINITY_DN2295_c0_g1_i1:78-530(-)
MWRNINFQGTSDIQELEVDSEDGKYWTYRATWMVDVANDEGEVLFTDVAALFNYGWHSEDDARANLNSVAPGENSTICSYPADGPVPYPLEVRFGKIDIQAAYIGVSEDTIATERRRFLDLFITGIFFISVVGCILCSWIVFIILEKTIF